MGRAALPGGERECEKNERVQLQGVFPCVTLSREFSPSEHAAFGLCPVPLPPCGARVGPASPHAVTPPWARVRQCFTCRGVKRSGLFFDCSPVNPCEGHFFFPCLTRASQWTWAAVPSAGPEERPQPETLLEAV